MYNLSESVSESFLAEIEQMTKAKARLAEVMEKNNELELLNEKLQQDLQEATGQ